MPLASKGISQGFPLFKTKAGGNGERGRDNTLKAMPPAPPDPMLKWLFPTRAQKPLDCILKNNRIAPFSPRNHFSLVIWWSEGNALKVTSQQLFFVCGYVIILGHHLKCL